jgi:hypothetical protein
MERRARWGQELRYKKEEELFKEEFHIDVTDSYLHHLTDYVGEKMLAEDEAAARKWEVMLESGKGAAAMSRLIPRKATKKGVFYIMIDGSMLNTRDKPVGESSWKEGKLALFFAASDAIRQYEVPPEVIDRGFTIW